MRIMCNRQRLVVALTAVLVGFGPPARPFGIVGVAQSSQQAAIGARLMRGAVDLHYHLDPGYSDLGHLRRAGRGPARWCSRIITNRPLPSSSYSGQNSRVSNSTVDSS